MFFKKSLYVYLSYQYTVHVGTSKWYFVVYAAQKNSLNVSINLFDWSVGSNKTKILHLLHVI